MGSPLRLRSCVSEEGRSHDVVSVLAATQVMAWTGQRTELLRRRDPSSESLSFLLPFDSG